MFHRCHRQILKLIVGPYKILRQYGASIKTPWCTVWEPLVYSIQVWFPNFINGLAPCTYLQIIRFYLITYFEIIVRTRWTNFPTSKADGDRHNDIQIFARIIISSFWYLLGYFKGLGLFGWANLKTSNLIASCRSNFQIQKRKLQILDNQ